MSYRLGRYGKLSRCSLRCLAQAITINIRLLILFSATVSFAFPPCPFPPRINLNELLVLVPQQLDFTALSVLRSLMLGNVSAAQVHAVLVRYGIIQAQ